MHPDYKLLIFDWDGTLADSIGRIVEAMHVASDRSGLARCDDFAVKGIIGLGLPEAIRTLYPHISDAELVDFRQHYADHYIALEAEPSPLFAGVVQSLEAFRREGYHLAVATGKARRGLDRVLKAHGWEDYFDITRAADETASKPHPLMLEQILAHCEVRPEQALMVGDSSFDLLMARNAGMASVAVSYGAQSLEALQAYEPRLSIDSFPQLHAWLSQRGN
ncbi:HAD-IA family hydrolase [Pseudomonas chlororaphis subsp. aurantiaca]|uniref:HAD-IA family hydrolase n=1 Tax=Pseudomonas TaxID=286 RepID=UPI000C88C477|nr:MULTISPECIES: HAD-IA family hydrolase [Pseudomonas]AZC88127.1 phosphoglycolate phosphatase-like [Pseudomonas chlororaphis subsp. piscium]NNB44972.1 HAD-IA family hydrolase [Pseudomonas chlororaphis]PMY44456.1 HAD family hydrolase [Pseudomonas sp. FW306-2-2C-D06C]PYC42244.1 HAD family hydrolase [Pseudomonas chlororaphis]WMJ01735.1 HAD-IA family hydrolase [Pseudomonas chlororaphis subsp. aurantiaca]